MYSVWEKLEKREKASLMGIYAISLALVWLLGYGWGRSSNASVPSIQAADVHAQGGVEVIDLSQSSSPTPGAPTEQTTALESPPHTEVVVHVSGAVKRAGVYRLSSQSRIADALEQAGGASELADLDALNLAEPLQDGQKIYVPRKGEASALPHATAALPRSQSAIKATAAPTQFPINLNTATAEQLETLPGIGSVLAQRIIEYRQMHGRFQSVDELLEVQGIGTKRLENIRPYVVVK